LKIRKAEATLEDSPRSGVVQRLFNDGWSFIKTSLSTELRSPNLFIINKTDLDYTAAGSLIQSYFPVVAFCPSRGFSFSGGIPAELSRKIAVFRKIPAESRSRWHSRSGFRRFPSGCTRNSGTRPDVYRCPDCFRFPPSDLPVRHSFSDGR
jgi:hypothetical protein